MMFSNPVLIKNERQHLFRPGKQFRLRKPALLLLLLGMLMSAPLVRAQSEQTSTDPQTLQTLLQRIDQLEARVRQLEAAQHQTTPVAESKGATSSPSVPPLETHRHGPTLPLPAAEFQQTNTQVNSQQSSSQQNGTPSNSSQEHETEPAEHTENERMDLSKTLLRIRGFADVTLSGNNYHPPNQEGDKTAFALGQLNLFVTSDISDRFKFLSEIVFEASPNNTYGVVQGPANQFGVDVERYLLTYSYNDYFNLSVGRYHTAIGYYNTAFHHSTWLQTTTGRPLLFEFEDHGGILPIHNVGVEAYGRIPSGSLGLHYVAEIGNGRGSRNALVEEPVQNVESDKTHKAVNFEIFARPKKFPGLQTGFSVYRDVLIPNGLPVGETILAGHVIYSTSNFEWLNEALVIRHTPNGGHLFETPGWYSQISRRFGLYRPYFRYQYINASSQEPIFPDIGLRAGPSAGIRYDASESVALKLQYDYNSLRNQHATQGLEAQIGFTF